MFVKNDLRYGHLLKNIMDFLSRGHGEPDVFILRITLVTFSYDGGDWLKGIEGSGKDGIQLRHLNILFGVVSLNK